VTLDGAGDARHRIRRERRAARGVEAVDRSDEGKAGDLLEVLERLGAAAIPARKAARQRKEPLDGRVAGARISSGVVRAEQSQLLFASCWHFVPPLEYEEVVRSSPICSGPCVLT
jgi:hypothetical protein